MSKKPSSGVILRKTNGSSRYQAVISYRVRNFTTGAIESRREFFSTRTSDKREAERLAHSRLAILERSVSGAKSVKISLKEARDKFLAQKSAVRKQSSVERYAVSFERFVDAFGEDKDVLSITRSDLLDFETSRRAAGASPSSVVRDLDCLSSMFSFLTWSNEDVEVSNVALSYKKWAKRNNGLRNAGPRHRVATDDEILAIRAEIDKRLKRTSHSLERQSMRNLRIGMDLTLETGLRKNELLSLEWSSIDLSQRRITVQAENSKTGQRRYVVLSKAAIAAIRSAERAPGCAFLIWYPSEIDGSPDRIIDNKASWHSVTSAAGVDGLRWHDLRRTCGSRWLNGGMPMSAVSRLLGHQSITQTERAYAFMRDDTVQGHIDRIEDDEDSE